MLSYFRFRHDELLVHYHERSNVESAFSMVKRQFGDSVKSKDDVAMFNEVLWKFLAHNLCCLITGGTRTGDRSGVFGEDSHTENKSDLAHVS